MGISKQLTTALSFALTILLSISTSASSMYTTYQAKIIKPDGSPLESTSVNFRFTILDPLGSCILYTENFNTINMAGSGGLVYFSLGSGIKTFPASGSVSFSDVFNNQNGALSCEVGGPPSYIPTANDLRKIVMQFHDGTGWQTLPAMAINHVPYAMYAKNAASATTAINSTQLNGKTDLDFVQVTSIPTCATSQALQFNGASFNCVAVGSNSGGTVVSISGSSPVMISGSASAPVISISVASTTSDGYLTAADYAEFKAKLSASSTEIANTLGYTPANSATVSTLQSNLSAVSATANNALVKSNNLSDLTNAATARTNLGLGAFATVSSLSASDVTTALGYTPQASGVISSQWNTSGTTINYTSGNVGIGTIAPIAKLSVSGGVQISMESAACAVNYAGTLRYNAGAVQFCNGTTWSSFGVAGSGITTLNGSTSGTQSFATGTAGNSPAFQTANGVHTLNIPLASAGSVTAGLISNADYIAFTNKMNATASAVVAALGYTPANSATVSTLQNNLSTVSTTANNALVKSNNLSDLTNAATARSNLGLGSLATASSIDLGSASATGIISDARLPNQVGVTSGTQYTKVTVDGKGRVTSGAQLSASDVTTALGYTPQASGSVNSFVNGGNSFGSTASFGTNDNNDLAIKRNGSTIMTVKSTGLSMNGVNSVNAYKISADINDSIAYQSSSSSFSLPQGNWGLFSTNANSTDGATAFLNLSTANALSNVQRGFMGIYSSASGYAPTMVFGTQTGATAYSERMRISSTGNVGIGTTNPAAQLDVVGTVSATSTITAANFSISGGNGNPAVLKSYQDSGGNGSLYVGNLSGGSSTNGFNTFFNTIVGHSSYGNNSTGTGNTVVGKSSYTGSSGSNNTFMGTFSGQRVIGDDNILLGAYAGQGVTGSNITGNVIIGRNAGNAITTGAYNTIIGAQAVSNTISSGSYNILIGYQTTLPVSNTSNFLNIGNLIYGQLSTAKIGIGTTTPATKLSVSGGLQISMESASCSATYAGTLRYSAGSVQFCDGTTWSAFGVAANYLVKSNNLSDLTSSATARTNLGLGTFATASTIDLSSASATGILSVTRLPSLAGDVTSVSGSNSLTVNGLQGRSVASTAPTSGQVLAYNGSAWAPVSLTASGDFLKDGSVAMTGAFKASDGTAAAPSIAFASDTNTGFYKDYADSFAMVANGSIMFSFGYGSMISTATNGAKINTAAGTATNPVYTFNGVHNSGMFAPGGQVLAFSTSSTERVRIDDSGDVGIGTITPGSRLVVKGAGTTSATSTLNITNSSNTSLFYVRDDGRVGVGSTSPEGRMEVAGLAWGNYASTASTSYYPFHTSGQATSFMEITNTATGYSSPGAYLGLKTTAMSGTPYQRAYIGVVSNMGASHTPDVIIGQQTGATAYQERLRINSAGNVGIGTTNPSEKLHVSGGASGAAGTIARFKGNSSWGSIDFYTMNTNTSFIGDFNVMNAMGWDTSVNALRFLTNGNERLRVDNQGKMGIGTTAPGYTLDVSGTLRVTGQAYTNTGNGSFSILSDVRYKDVHGKFDRGLAEILNVDIIKFNYKKDNPLGSDSSREYVGVSAQNLQQVIPEAVEIRKENKEEYLTINTSPVLWTLINAVKQLYAQIIGVEGSVRQIASIVESKADKSEIEDLRKDNVVLKAENAALKSYLCSKDPAAPICK